MKTGKKNNISLLNLTDKQKKYIKKNFCFRKKCAFEKCTKKLHFTLSGQNFKNKIIKDLAIDVPDVRKSDDESKEIDRTVDNWRR